MAIEIKNCRLGFFSDLLYVLNMCHLAEKTDDDIIVENFSHLYYDEKMGYQNSFLQYFEDTYKNIDKTKKYPIKYHYLPDVENVKMYNGLPICGFILDIELRKYIKFLIDKYIKIKPHIKEKINIIFENNFKSKKVLGVHVRQTDHGEHGKLVPNHIYLNIIKQNINNFDLLYVMADNYFIINELRAIYGDKLFFIEDIIRSKDNIKLTILEEGKYDKYKLGEDILIETILLSKCQKVILTNSNIGNFVMANNQGLNYEYVDLKIKN